MDYTTLGRTGLTVSVAGLGGGGGSQLGLDRGGTRENAANIVRLALDLGINFIDTAHSYFSEEAIGDALRGVDRSKVVLGTKFHISPYRDPLNHYTPEEIIAGLDESLRRLGTDYVDIFYLHALTVPRLDYALDVLVPALLREREKGKFRFLGATEAPTVELAHQGLSRALDSDVFDVAMIGFQLLHQNAREILFPKTMARNIGTVMMFVVRNIFADPAHLRATVRKLVEDGKLPIELAEEDNPLGFLVHEGGARNVVDAAYRFVRHEPGVDVVLFGTGNPDHLRRNVASCLAPPLPAADIARARALFGGLVGAGLDIPNRVPPALRSSGESRN